VRDLPNYASSATTTNCNAEALLWLEDATTTTGRLYLLEKRVRSFNHPRILEIGLGSASGRRVGAPRAGAPTWASSDLVNLPPDVPTMVGATPVRLDESLEITGAAVSQNGQRAVITLGNCGFLVYDSPTTAAMFGVLRDNDDNPATADPPGELPGHRLYGNATRADDVAQRNSCQTRSFGITSWGHDDGGAAGFQPGPMGIEGVTFVGATNYLSMVEDTTFLDTTGKALLGSRMVRIVP
jgi:hypothetical protein